MGLSQVAGFVDHLGDNAANAPDPELQLGQTDDPAQLIHAGRRLAGYKSNGALLARVMQNLRLVD